MRAANQRPFDSRSGRGAGDPRRSASIAEVVATVYVLQAVEQLRRIEQHHQRRRRHRRRIAEAFTDQRKRLAAAYES
ncbi:hypothetical protein AYM40_27435 [Paraburkholderia phytofirmans OLGA172]|uniref:Uncharacterized protein n=1 Tax=Paraburkholderia phytofirmans OLGA172 TaxID=1417228 RepID=A0A167WDT2_9BURK|nr:hypothetical protein AYM40_27435 [Paraburkholderia phytofirmans OLGA172]